MRKIFFLLCLLTILPTARLASATATWNVNSNGNWNVNGNWDTGTFPNGAADIANFLNVITANRNITLGQDITIATINTDDNNRYTIRAVPATANSLIGITAWNNTNVNGNGANRIQCPITISAPFTVTHTGTANIRLQGVISGTGSFVKEGAGTGNLRLGAVNTYTGTTTINEGNVRYEIDGAIPTGSAVTVGSGGGASALLNIRVPMTNANVINVNLNSGGVLTQRNNRRVKLSELSGSGTINLSTGTNNGSLFDIRQATSTTYSGTITGGATSVNTNPAQNNRLIKNSTGTLTLTGMNSYVSRTFIANGILNVQNDFALGAAGTGSIAFVQGGGTLEIQGGISLPKDIHINGAGFSSGAISNVSGSNTITGSVVYGWSGGAESAADPTIALGAGSRLNMSSGVSGLNALTITGTGTLEYSGTVANTQSGNTTIQGGTLELNKTGMNATAGNVIVSGGALTFTQSDQIVNTASVTANSGSISLGAQSETIDSFTFNAGTLTHTTGTLTLGNAGGTALSMRNTTIPGPLAFTGGGDVVFDSTNNGTATISNTVNLGTSTIDFSIANGTAATDMLMSGAISNGGITKTGAGTLELTGANTYASGTTVTAGVLQGTTTGLQGTITNNASVVFDQTTTGTYAGVMSGTGSLTKQNTGTVILTGANTYSGGTTVSAGVLQGTTTGLQGAILNNASVVFDQTTTGTYAGVMSGTGSLTKQNTGTVILSGANTYSGGTTVTAGVLQGTTTSLQGNITNNASLIFNQTITGTYSDIISGTGSITKQNTGTTILTGANTYSGGTTVSGGTLQGNTTSLQGNIVNNATLIFDQSANGTFSSIISGTGSVTKQNTGTLTLSGANTYSGGSTVSAGTLQGTTTSVQGAIVNNAAVIFDQTTTGTYSGAMSGTGTLTKLGTGTTILTGANTYSGGTTVTAGVLQGTTTGLQGAILNNASVVFDQTTTGTYAGIMSGTGSLTKQNTGTVILSGANTYSGGTTVSAGVLQGTTTSLQGNITNNASLVFNQTITGTYSDIISGTGSVTKENTGTTILTGANTYSGGTTVTAGVLQGNTTSLQGNIVTNANLIFDQSANGTFSSIISGTGSVTKQNTGTLTLTGANTYSGGSTVSAGTLQGTTTSVQGAIVNNAAVIFDQTITGTYAGVMSGTGTLTKLGTGTTILTGANTYSGGTTVTAGVLQGTTTSLQGNIANSASVVFNQIITGTYSDIISGTGSVTKENIGTTILTGANTYSGGTTVSGGILQGNTTSLQGNIVNNATLIFDQSANGTFSSIISGTGSVTKQNAGTLTLTGANTYSGGSTVSAGTLQGTTTSVQGAIVNNAAVVFNQTTTGTYSGAMSGTGTLTKLNTGTVILTGANSYSGGTTVTGGVLQGTTTGLQGAILNNASVVFDQTTTGTYAGVMSGTGSLTKQNTGTVILSGANTYSGGTTVTAGVLHGTTTSLQGNITNNAALVFNQTITGTYSDIISGTGSVTKQNTGTTILTGANTYSGGTTVSGGTLQGNTTSLQGNIVTNATLVFDQSANGTFSDIISGTGSVTKQNTGTLTLSGANTYSGGSTVSAGTLQGTTTSVQGAIVNNAAVIFDQTTTGTYSGAMSGTGTLTKLNTGTVILTGANSYSGGTTVTGGVLQGTTTGLQGAITNNAAVVFDQTTTGTYAGVMSGTGSLTKQNTGTVILSGANTYSGGTIVTAGVLQGTTSSLQGNIANNASVVFNQTITGTYSDIISGTGSVTKQNTGTTILTGANTYSGGTTVSGGILQGNTTSLQGNIVTNAMLVFDQAANGTFSSIISGTGSVTKQNTGTLTLTGANTYSGGTTVSAGILEGTTTSLQGAILNNAGVTFDQTTTGTYSGVMSGTGSFTKENTGTVIITGANTYSGGTTVTGGVLQGTTTSLQGDITNNSSLVFNQTFNGTYSDIISGTGSVTKENTGTVIFTGANTYTGGTTISGGTLQGNTGSLPGNIVNNGTLVFDQAVNGTYSNIISGTGAVTKLNVGILTLSGANTYSGGTTVTGGTLQGTTTSLQGAIINNAAVIFDQTTTGTYAGVMSGTGSLTKLDTGTVILTGANTYSGGTTVTGGVLQGTTTSLQGDITNNASVVFNQTTTGTYAGIISGTGSVTKENTGTVIVTGVNTYSGGTTVSGGILQGTTTSLQGDITNNAAVVFNQTFTGTYSDIISGTGSVTKQNTGTVIFTGANTYSGGTTVSAGVLQGNTTSLQGNIANNASLIFDQAANGTFSDIISGTGSVTKLNTGTLTLSGANTYSGGTTVTAGTLQGTTTSLQGAIVNNAAVVFDQTITETYAGVMSGTGSLTKLNTGTVILTGANTYSGGTTVSAGVLQGTTTGLQGDITNNASVVFNQTSTGTYAGIISGTGSVTKENTGTVIVTGANTYSGGTTVSGGILQGTTTSLQGDITNTATVVFNQTFTGTYSDIISGTGSVTKQNTGTVILTGANTYSGGTTVSAGVLQGNTTSLQGNIANNASVIFDQLANGTYAGVMSGTGSLTKQNTGTLTLSGANTYSGGTTVTAGTLQGTTTSLQGAIVNDAAVVFDQTITGTYAGVMSGTGSLTKLNTGAVILTGANTYSGGTTVTAGVLQGTTTGLQGDITNNASVVFNQTTTGTYAGIISGTGSVTKENTGTVIVTGANTYSGGTTVSGGILQGTTTSLQGDITNNASLIFNQVILGTYSDIISGTGSVTKQNTGTVILTGANTYSGGTTVSGGILQGNTTSLQGNIANNASVIFDQLANGTYAGVMSGTGSLTKQNTGTLTLSGANTYSGGTTVTAGTLQGTTTSLQGAIVNDAAVVFDQTITGTYAGVMSGTGSLTKLNTGTVILTGANTYSGGTTVTAGVLQGTTTGLQGDITNNASVVFNQTSTGTFAGIISGSGSLTKQNTGTVVLSGANTYSGGTTVTAGVLQGTTTSLQGNITNNASLIFNQVILGTYSGVISGTGSVTKQNTGTTILTGANTYSGGTTVSGGLLQGNTTSLQGNIVNNAILVFDQAANDTFSDVISGSGSVRKLNVGTLTLSGANTYSGGTTVTGGTLQGTTTSLQGNIINNSAVIFDQAANGTYSGVISGSGSLTKQSAGIVTLSGVNTYTGGTTVTAGALRGPQSSFPGDIVNNSAIIFDQATTATYSSVISGTGSVTKQNVGTLFLTGASTVGGTTTITGGALRINNTYAGAGNIVVGPGGTLGGVGPILKDITVNGKLAPGNSIMTLSVTGDVVQAAGSTLEIEIDDTSADLLDITGSYAIGANTTLELIPTGGIFLPEYTIVQATSGVSGTFANVTNISPLFTLDVIYNANEILLTTASSPFPIFPGNAGQVANCFNSFEIADGSDLFYVCEQLKLLQTDEEIENALLQLQPSALTSLAQMQQNSTLSLRNSLFTHLDRNVHAQCENEILQPNKLTVWGATFAGQAYQPNKKMEPGFKSTNPGAILGVDKALGEMALIGVAAAYTYADLDWKRSRGEARVHSGYLSLYGQIENLRAFLQGSLFGSYNAFREERDIQFSSINRTAKSHHYGLEGSAHLKGGLLFNPMRVQVSPYFLFDYLYLFEDDYTETGAKSLNLHMDNKRSDLLVSSFGVDISRCIKTTRHNITPFLQLEVIRESRFRGKSIKADFNGCTLDVNGLNPSRTLFGYAAGINLNQLTKKFETTISTHGKYSTEFFEWSFNLELGKSF